jgi:hypothetical protein
LSYGYNGNIKNDIAAVPVIRYSPNSPVTNLPFSTVINLPNPSLRWERSGIVNVGLDAETKDRKLTLALDFYTKRSIDLLAPAQVDPTLGLTSMTMNTANLTGNGFDARLHVTVFDQVVKWNVDAIFSHVTNKVTRYLPSFASKGGYAGFSNFITPIAGYDPYALISFKWAGLDPQTGDPMGYIGGVLSKDYTKLTTPQTFDELVIEGTTRAPYFGNLIQTLAWKGLSLSANISGRFGYYFRRSSLNYTSFFNSWQGNVEYEDRWQKPGDELLTNVPSMVYPSITARDNFYNNSEATVEKGDVIRVQDIRLGFEYKKINTWLQVNNAGILWRANHLGLDPEYGSLIPPRASFSAGCKITF